MTRFFFYSSFTSLPIQAKYLGHHWAVTKFCTAQFKGAHDESTKAKANAFRHKITSSKGYDDLEAVLGPWKGEEEFQDIVRSVESRDGRRPRFEELDTAPASPEAADSPLTELTETTESDVIQYKTPVNSLSPNPSLTRAPLGPANEHRKHVPAMISGHDEPTPTHTPGAEFHSPLSL